MGIFRSIYRYIITLGGLIESGIDGSTDDLLSTPSGIKASYQKTRENWTQQYSEVREAVAHLMMVLEQKRKRVNELKAEADQVKIKLKGAVGKFKETNDTRYQQAFNELYTRDQAIGVEQEQLDKDVQELHAKVDTYKVKLNDMQKRITDLKKKEASAIADIVSSQQIIKLNDRLNHLSTDLDDRNLQAIEERRQNLGAQAKLSGELAAVEDAPNIDQELMAAGMKSEAADIFAAMLAEEDKTPATATEKAAAEGREL